MASTTGSFFDTQEAAMEEVIYKTVDSMLPSLDPAWRDMFTTSQGVVPASLLGRDYEVYRVFRSSYAGVIDEAQASNEFGLYGDPNTQSYGQAFQTQDIQSTFPDATAGARSLPFVLKIPLRGWHTNLLWTMAELRAEATESFIGQVIAPKLREFGGHLAHRACNSFYTSQNSNYLLCTTTSVTVAGSAAPWTITLTPSNLSPQRFYKGMPVDLYTNSGGLPATRANDTQASAANQTTATRIRLFVVSADYTINRIVLATNVDPATWTGAAVSTGSTTYHVLPANNRTVGTSGTAGFRGIAGINSWLKFGTGTNGTDTPANNPDNYLLGTEAIGTTGAGAINVNTHPEFKSFLKAIGGYLTEHKLVQCVRGFNAANRPFGKYLDCLIASDGVWMGYRSQRIGMERVDRTGSVATLSAQGISDGAEISFSVDGRTVKGYTSNFIESGTLYGLRKGGNNWRKIVPPNPAGATANPDAPGNLPFRFVGTVMGGSSRIPISRVTAAPGNTLVTEGAQQPGMLYMQLVPWEQPNGLKLTGITEDRLFGDTTFS